MTRDYDYQVESEAPVLAEDADASMESVLTFAEGRTALIKRIKELALEHTTENDWVLQSGSLGPVPYLQASGAEKIARLFGVGVRDLRSQRYMTRPSPDGPEFYVWEYTATFYLVRSPGDAIVAVGSRSSADKFFQSQKVIDERDVKMSAYSNLMVNGYTRLLGLRGLTVEMLQKAGLNPTKMRGVTYRDKGGVKETGAQPSKSPPSPPDKKTAMKLLSLIEQIVGSDEENQKRFLEEITTFESREGELVPGVRSLKGMSAKRVEVTLGRLRQAMEANLYPTDGSYYGGDEQ